MGRRVSTLDHGINSAFSRELIAIYDEIDRMRKNYLRKLELERI